MNNHSDSLNLPEGNIMKNRFTKLLVIAGLSAVASMGVYADQKPNVVVEPLGQTPEAPPIGTDVMDIV